MIRKERKERFSLTMLFAALVFAILFVSVALTLGVVYLLTFMGWVPAYDGTAVETMPVLMLMVMISLVIGFGTAVLAGHFPMKPINKVINTMNRLADGDFKARLPESNFLKSYPSLREVTESFNKMAEELDRTEVLRRDFINNFSHEFKTPIVSIAGFAKLLRRGNLTESQKEEYLAIIEEEALRLAEMATNTLNLTRIENQTILSDVTEFNLSEQLRYSVLLLEDQWMGKEIEPDLEFPECRIRGSEDLLKQVWVNLLENAIKFSPNRGEILVRMAETETTLKVMITNYGSEIPADKQDKIWNKFYQVDESHGTRGNGIGLAVVKRVVELHGGNVSVTSQNDVTTFTVELPKT